MKTAFGMLLVIALCACTVGRSKPVAVHLDALGNAAILVSDGVNDVLLDACIPEKSPWDFHWVQPDDWAAMRDGTGRFANADVAVVSHVHADHFQAVACRTWLEAKPGRLLYAPPAAAAGIRALGYSGSGLREVDPAAGEVIRRRHGGLDLDIFLMPHFPDPEMKPVNLGVVITLDGKRVLHAGDVYPAAAQVDLPPGIERGIDLVLLPYWFFENSYIGGLAAAKKAHEPRRIAVYHLDRSGEGEFRRQLRVPHPDIKVLTKSGDRLEIE